jgi:PKD repeat protein
VGAGSSGRLLLFDVTTAVLSKHEPATVNVLQFGAGGEECGHARATAPSVSVLGEPVTKVPAGKTALLSLNVFGADALGVEWRFKNTTTGKEEADEQPVMESYPFPTQVPALTHEFKHGGNYEIIAIVEPDDFGPKIEEHLSVTVEGGEGGNGGAALGAEFSYTSPATVGQPAKFAAKVTDPNNKASPHVQYKYVWEFGDGTKMEGSGGREFRAEHAYAGAGRYEVKLTVIDEGDRSAEATHVVQVSLPRIPATISSLGTGSAGGSGGGSSGGSTGASSAGISVVPSTHVPAATLAGTMSLAVNRSGVLTLKLACPAGETSCSGTVTLRTLRAVKAGVRAKMSVLTLATGSFTVVGGRVKAVTLRLSAGARALLAHLHALSARATLQAHDPAGATHTTQTVVTLRIAKPSHLRVNKR